MLAAALIAYGHFLSFFALVVALVLELALLTQTINLHTARRIQRADRVYGMAAILLLTFGLLRVFYFDKGGDYYFSNSFFLLKLGLFICVGLLSIYPTLQFIRWSAGIKHGVAPQLSQPMLARLKKIIHWELVLIAGILLCASLMAKGFGS